MTLVTEQGNYSLAAAFGLGAAHATSRTVQRSSITPQQEKLVFVERANGIIRALADMIKNRDSESALDVKVQSIRRPSPRAGYGRDTARAPLLDRLTVHKDGEEIFTAFVAVGKRAVHIFTGDKMPFAAATPRHQGFDYTDFRSLCELAEKRIGPHLPDRRKTVRSAEPDSP